MEIYELCERHGYGNVMQWASSLWKYKELKDGNPTAHCFVPTCKDFIKKKYQCEDEQKLYLEIVKKIMDDGSDQPV